MHEIKLTAQEFEALQEFLVRASLPILLDEAEGPDPLGTGILLEHAGRYFLVTADHVLEGVEIEKLLVPLGRQGDAISQIGDLMLARPIAGGPDVAIIELKHKEVVRRLGENWRFITLDMTGAGSVDTDHVLVGYPAKLAERDGRAVHASPLAIFTEMLAGTPTDAKAVNPAWDIFFALDTVGHLGNGEVYETPRLNGASGAPVWEITASDDELWAPEKTLKLIGVQQSALHGKWFRATKWEVVRAFLEKL